MSDSSGKRLPPVVRMARVNRELVASARYANRRRNTFYAVFRPEPVGASVGGRFLQDLKLAPRKPVRQQAIQIYGRLIRGWLMLPAIQLLPLWISAPRDRRAFGEDPDWHCSDLERTSAPTGSLAICSRVFKHTLVWRSNVSNCNRDKVHFLGAVATRPAEFIRGLRGPCFCALS